MCGASSSVGNYELYVSKYSVVSTDLIVYSDGANDVCSIS